MKQYRKIEASGASFSACPDRFVTVGYRKGMSPMEQLEELATIKGLEGIPVAYPLDFKNTQIIKELFTKYGKSIGTIAPDTYINPRIKNGTLTNRDKGIRHESIQMIKESMDVCAELGGSDVLLWLAHDGFDYPFEDDYTERFNMLLEGLDEVCSYRHDVKVTIEYKKEEPRTHQYISDVGMALYICRCLQHKQNLGMVVDIGHALFAGENPAQAIALTAAENKLFHIHLNDNYRHWDDDLVVGGIHFWETLECFYMLDKVNYDGWLTIDIYPTRVNGRAAIEESIARIHMFEDLAATLPRERLMALQKENDTVEIMKLLREHCIRNYN